MSKWKAGLLAASLVVMAPVAKAEVPELNVAQQWGVSFLPMMIMQRDHLVENHAKKAGIENLKVNWSKVAGPSVMNDGLISGSLHFAAQGAPSLITLWNKTRKNKNVQIKGVSAMTTYPLYLMSRNPAVKTVKDFTSKDKIAVPSVKISTQAIMLQIAAAKAFGQDQYQKLDPLTVSLSHPDGLLAFMNNTAGVNAHFTSSPYYEEEAKMPDAHLVTTNYEILGGPATAVVMTASSQFRDANPKTYKAFLGGLKEAMEIINKDKRAAAQAYLTIANDKRNTVDTIYAIISNKDYRYTLKPEKVLKTAQFMAKVGSVSQAPEKISDLFFPEIADLGGD